jgi:hypothetical protein
MQKYRPVFLVLIGILAVMATGCVNSSGDTPVPASHNVTMVQISLTKAAAPELSGACKDLAAETEDDAAFLGFINNDSIVSRTYDLVYFQCEKVPAAEINQLLISNPKPKTPSLVQAREYLISATTYCQVPESASPDRTESDLEKFIGKMGEFHEILSSCRDQLGENISSLQKFQESGDIIRLRGSGDDVIPFSVTGDGLRIITLKNTGDSPFIVWLRDDKGDPVNVLVSEFGPYSGKTSEKMMTGNYFADITADGPWAISFISV